MSSIMSLHAPGTIISASRSSKRTIVCSRPRLTSCKVNANVRLPAQKTFLSGSKPISSGLSQSVRQCECPRTTCSAAAAAAAASPGIDLGNHEVHSNSRTKHLLNGTFRINAAPAPAELKKENPLILGVLFAGWYGFNTFFNM